MANENSKNIYKAIEDFERLYEINSAGIIQSLDRVVIDKRWGTKKLKGGIKKSIKNKYGYLRVNLHKGGKPHFFNVHRLVALAFIPNPDNKPMVNHKDGNKINNDVSNLEWCTALENSKHATATGLHNVRGENNVTSKLTEKQVYEIRQLLSQKVPQIKLAEKYGVKQAHISSIKLYKTWNNTIPKP